MHGCVWRRKNTQLRIRPTMHSVPSNNLVLIVYASCNSASRGELEHAPRCARPIFDAGSDPTQLSQLGADSRELGLQRRHKIVRLNHCSASCRKPIRSFSACANSSSPHVPMRLSNWPSPRCLPVPHWKLRLGSDRFSSPMRAPRQEISRLRLDLRARPLCSRKSWTTNDLFLAGHDVVKADSGQSNLGCRCVVVLCGVFVCCVLCCRVLCCRLCVVVCVVVGVLGVGVVVGFGPYGSLPSAGCGPPCAGPPCAGPPYAGPPKISLFLFPLPPHVRSFCLSLGVFSLNFGGVFEAPKPSNVHVWALGLSCEVPATTRTPNVHISGPRRFKHLPKYHERTPKRVK